MIIKKTGSADCSNSSANHENSNNSSIPEFFSKQVLIEKITQSIEPVDLHEKARSMGASLRINEETGRKYLIEKDMIVVIVHLLLGYAEKSKNPIKKMNAKIHAYSGKNWIKLEKEEIITLLRRTGLMIGLPEVKARNEGFLDKLQKQLEVETCQIADEVKSNTLINLLNCTLKITNDSKIPVMVCEHHPDDYLTTLLPFEYKPDAKCPMWNSFLDEVLDKETQRTLQEVIGSIFIKTTPKVEKVAFLYGQGSNGKSVISTVISTLLGKENITQYGIESLTDRTGYYRSMMAGKLLNWGTDVKMKQINSDIFKTMASGEPIECRLPYGNPFIMHDYGKMIFNINDIGTFSIERTHGFFRRFIFIPFRNIIPDKKQDRQLINKLLEEKAGILNWVIEGTKSVLKNQDIFISKSCEDFLKAFKKETDSVQMWMDEENIVFSQGSVSYLKGLYIQYREYCSECGYKALGRGNYSKRLQEMGYELKRDSQGSYFELKKIIKNAA